MYSHLVFQPSAALRHRLYKSLWAPYKDTSAIVRKKKNPKRIVYLQSTILREKIIMKYEIIIFFIEIRLDLTVECSFEY